MVRVLYYEMDRVKYVYFTESPYLKLEDIVPYGGKMISITRLDGNLPIGFPFEKAFKLTS